MQTKGQGSAVLNAEWGQRIYTILGVSSSLNMSLVSQALGETGIIFIWKTAWSVEFAGLVPYKWASPLTLSVLFCEVGII